MPPGTDDPRLPAAVDLIGRTGSHQFVLRYCDEGQAAGEPVVWMAMARWSRHWEVRAGLSPLLATFALADSIIDGGECQHCHRPSGFDAHNTVAPGASPMHRAVCWYQYDPSTRRYLRGCGGDT